MLLPAKAEVARKLRRYRAWERLMLASPADPAARAAFEDAGYTLCVLMGERCAREAADSADRYLLATPVAYAGDRADVVRTGDVARADGVQSGRSGAREASPARHGPPAALGHSPAGT